MKSHKNISKNIQIISCKQQKFILRFIMKSKKIIYKYVYVLNVKKRMNGMYGNSLDKIRGSLYCIQVLMCMPAAIC